MTLTQLPLPPEGFEIVTEGRLRPGDLVLNPYENSWGGPTKSDIEALGREISFYYGVVRKNSVRRKRHRDGEKGGVRGTIFPKGESVL